MPWLGNLLVFGAVLCEAAYAVIGKTLTGALGPKRITVADQPLGLRAGRRRSASGAALRFDFGGGAAGIWLLLVFYALAASIWTVWLWMTGLKARARVAGRRLHRDAAGQRGRWSACSCWAKTLVDAADRCAFALALAGVVLATWPRVAPITQRLQDETGVSPL